MVFESIFSWLPNIGGFVSKHWREFLEDNPNKSKKKSTWDSQKVERIGKSKRSSKGRTTDDWIHISQKNRTKHCSNA
jgi:hypothetical protein